MRFQDEQMDQMITADFNLNKNPVTQQLSLEKYSQVLQTLGVEQKEIQKWQNHYTSKQQYQLSLAEIRYTLGLPEGGFNTYVQQPKLLPIPLNSGYSTNSYTAPQNVNPRDQTISYHAIQANDKRLNAINDEEIRIKAKQQQDALLAQQQEAQRLRDEAILRAQQQRGFRITIGPPPSFNPNDYYINNGIKDFNYSQHSQKLKIVMQDIHQFEEEIKQKVKFAGFQGGFSLMPKWEILDLMVDYIRRLKIELNNLQSRDSQNVRQINILIQYIIQYRVWYNWKIVQKNYWQEWQEAEARCTQLKNRIAGLELENRELRDEIFKLRQQIQTLELEIVQLKEKLRIIGFLQRIISTQAYECAEHHSTIDGHRSDLDGMEAHYRNHYGNIRAQMLSITQSIEAQPYAKQGGFNRDLRQAMTCVINNGAKKDKNTGQDVYDNRNEVKEVIRILMTMDESFQSQSIGLGIENDFATPPGFEENWSKYQQNGILLGKIAIMGFFEHVIAYRVNYKGL